MFRAFSRPRRRRLTGLWSAAESLESRWVLSDVGGLIQPDRFEPNDTLETATLVSPLATGPVRLTGLSLDALDSDFFRFVRC